MMKTLVTVLLTSTLAACAGDVASRRYAGYAALFAGLGTVGAGAAGFALVEDIKTNANPNISSTPPIALLIAGGVLVAAGLGGLVSASYAEVHDPSEQDWPHVRTSTTARSRGWR